MSKVPFLGPRDGHQSHPLITSEACCSTSRRSLSEFEITHFFSLRPQVSGTVSTLGCAVTNLALLRPAMFGEISDIARERGCPVCRRAEGACEIAASVRALLRLSESLLHTYPDRLSSCARSQDATGRSTSAGEHSAASLVRRSHNRFTIIECCRNLGCHLLDWPQAHADVKRINDTTRL